MNMTSSPPATAGGKLNCDPLRKIAHLGEDAKSPQKRNLKRICADLCLAAISNSERNHHLYEVFIPPHR